MNSTHKVLLVLGLVLLTVIFFAFLSTTAVDSSPFAGAQVQTVREVFVDLNGDGQVDFLLEGRVVINQGGRISNLPTPQP